MNVRRLTIPDAEPVDEPGYARTAAILIAALTLMRLCMIPFAGVGDAEAYYWTWSQHPALSYYDHPPMVAWMISATTALGGNAPFFIRLGPVLVFAAASTLVYRLATDVSGRRRVGLAALVLFQLTPAFAIGGQGANPDVPLGLLWLLTAWLLWHATTGEKRAWAWLAGLSLGLAFLSKYFAVLLALSAALWLSRREYRHWWRRHESYGAILLALACTVPVILWNVQHDWASVRLHFTRHAAAGFTLRQAGMFLGGQVLYYSPLLWGAYLYALVVAARRGLRGREDVAPKRSRAYAFVAILSLPALSFFTVVGFWTPESEPHWTAMGYVPLVLAAAMLWDERWPVGGAPTRRLRNFAWIATGLPAVLLVLAHVHILTPLFVPLVPERDRSRDLVAETSGWREVGARTRAIAATMRNPVLLHYHYTKCSQLWLSVNGELPLVCLNDRQDQFDFWQDEAALVGRDMLYVTDSVYDRRPDTLWRFDRCAEETPRLAIRRGGYLLRTFTFWRCEGYRGPVADRNDQLGAGSRRPHLRITRRRPRDV